MDALKRLGTVVWLSGDFDALYERALQSGDRPMLAGRTREDVRALHASRLPFYGQADVVVDTAELGPDQVASRVLALLRERARPAR